VDEIAHLAQQLDQQLRADAKEVHPALVEQRGLAAALEHLVDNFRRRTGLAVEFTARTLDRAPAPVEASLYRAVQEGLSNVARHAKATSVVVELERSEGELRCIVRDNGVGLRGSRNRRSAREQGIGLTTMRERLRSVGGRLELRPASSGGTEVVAAVRGA
jgi:signal transduction histidine kinase